MLEIYIYILQTFLPKKLFINAKINGFKGENFTKMQELEQNVHLVLILNIYRYNISLLLVPLIFPNSTTPNMRNPTKPKQKLYLSYNKCRGSSSY